MLGIHLGTSSSPIAPGYQRNIHTGLEFLWVLSFTVAASRFAGNAVRFYGGRVTGAQNVTSLSQKLVQLLVAALGLVWLLKVVFNTSLTPLLTAFGVGGLAVALAPAGHAFEPVRRILCLHLTSGPAGDYIKLSSGEEGFVADINWRCTTMRTITNNMVVIPNNKLGTTIYTNYYLPEPRMLMSVSFGVGNESDIDRVEAILLDETKAAAAALDGIPGASSERAVQPRPGDFSLIFQVNFSISRFSDQYLAQSELRKRIYKRLVKENISMPYPTKTVIVESQQNPSTLPPA